MGSEERTVTEPSLEEAVEAVALVPHHYECAINKDPWEQCDCYRARLDATLPRLRAAAATEAALRLQVATLTAELEAFQRREAERGLDEGPLMCEAHPGLPFMHDPDCPGPGMGWYIEGREAIEGITAERDDNEQHAQAAADAYQEMGAWLMRIPRQREGTASGAEPGLFVTESELLCVLDGLSGLEPTARNRDLSALRAENAALREALERVAMENCGFCGGEGGPEFDEDIGWYHRLSFGEGCVPCASATARAALAPSGGEDGKEEK